MAGFLIGGRLLSGLITIRQVMPRSASVELTLNAAESIDVGLKLPLVDPATGVAIDVPNQLMPGRDFIGWIENGVVLAAGQIGGDPFTFPAASSIKASGMGAYFDQRLVLPVLSDGQLPRDVTSAWSGWSLRTIAKRLVQQALAHPGADIPIDFEADEAGEHERNYPGSNGTWVGTALENLTKVEGGPDIAFRPKLGEDRRHVRWDMLTGDPQLTQDGADHYWDVSAPGAHAAVSSLVRDGRDLASRSFLSGATVENLAQDPSFEAGLGQWKINNGATNLIHATSNPFDGISYAAWNAAIAGTTFISEDRTYNIAEGDVITYSMHGRASAALGMFPRIWFHDVEGDPISHASANPMTMSVTEWTRNHVTAVAPAGSVAYSLHIGGVASSVGQTFAADGLMVTQGPELLPYAEEGVAAQARAQNSALLDAGFPLMESWENRSSVVRESTLQAYADEAVTRYSTHTETFTLRVKRDQTPKLGTYWPGDWAKIRIGKNPRIPADMYRVRIVRISFASEGDVTIECAPERVAGGYPVPASNRAWLTDQLRALNARVDETNRG